MTEALAQLLADRLAALPFADPATGARVAGLARLYTGTVNDGDAPRTLKLPVPAAWGADECTRDSRYLTPDLNTAATWFFEDYGTSEEKIAGNLYGSLSTLRLLGWVNPKLQDPVLSENQLLQAIGAALRLRVRHDAGEYRGLLITATVLPAETSLFGRYTFDAETPLLLPPFRLIGLELKCRYRLVAPCVPAEPEPVSAGFPYILDFALSE